MANTMPCEEEGEAFSSENHIPSDVLETIMLKLPIKSIVRFRAVSKAWNGVTLDPKFARAYFNNLFVVSPHKSEEGRYGLAKFNGAGFEIISDLRFPDDTTPYSILDSCDGFFLLYDGRESYVLWNPITGSNSSFAAYLGYPGKSYGICYDPMSDDYKVVYITSKWYTVYSCRNRSWTESKEFAYTIVHSKHAGVTVRGVPYWVFEFSTPGVEEEETEIQALILRRLSRHRTNATHPTFTYDIVYFDLAECEFKSLKKPAKLRGAEVLRLTCLNGRLCLYLCSSDCNHLQIWVLGNDEKNSDWIKLADIRNLRPVVGMGLSYHVKPLFVTEDDQRIVLEDVRTDGNRFVVYDILRKEISEGACLKLDGEGRGEVVGGVGSWIFPSTHDEDMVCFSFALPL